MITAVTLDKRYLELTTQLLKNTTTHLLRYTPSITLNTKQTLPEITKYITALLVKEVVV